MGNTKNSTRGLSDYIHREINLLEEDLKEDTSNQESGFGFDGVHILVADNDQQLVFFIEKTLQKHLFNEKISQSSEFKLFFSILDREEIDLLIININFFPSDKRDALLEHLYYQKLLRNIPILFLSDQNSKELFLSLNKMDTNRLSIDVPFSENQLIKSVATLLS
jgi:DNA-binding response OmpR family regulator